MNVKRQFHWDDFRNKRILGSMRCIFPKGLQTYCWQKSSFLPICRRIVTFLLSGGKTSFRHGGSYSNLQYSMCWEIIALLIGCRNVSFLLAKGLCFSYCSSCGLCPSYWLLDCLFRIGLRAVSFLLDGCQWPFHWLKGKRTVSFLIVGLHPLLP